MLDLYHHGSSACAAKVRFDLAEKRLDWTGHYVDILAGEQFKPQFLAINPKAVVPMLVHNGEIIPESTVVCEYVEMHSPIILSILLPRSNVRGSVSGPRRGPRVASGVFGHHLCGVPPAYDSARWRRKHQRQV